MKRVSEEDETNYVIAWRKRAWRKNFASDNSSYVPFAEIIGDACAAELLELLIFRH